MKVLACSKNVSHKFAHTKRRRRNGSHGKLIRSAIAVAVSNALLVSAQAATITVNSPGDVSENDSDCTLREAIISANSDSAGDSGCVSGAGADVIIFASDVRSISFAQSLELGIYSNVEIQGSRDNPVTIDADELSRVFGVSSGNSRISDVVIRGGETSSVAGGGGIRQVGGSLVLERTSIYDNSVTATNAYGGGVRLTGGSLSLIDSVVQSNSATGRGGGIDVVSSSASLTVERSAFVDNYAEDRSGALNVTGSVVTLSNVSVLNNSAPIAAGIRASGSAATVGILNSTIVGNSSSSYGSALTARFDAEIQLSNSVVSGNPSDSSVEIRTSGDATITANNSNIFGDASINNLQLAPPSEFIPGPNDRVATSDALNLSLGEIVNLGGEDRGFLTLPEDSIARNNGNSTICAAAPVANQDQRGFSRSNDDQCDIGAVEMTGVGTIIVDSKSDAAGGTDCTLRDAFISLNTFAASGGCSAAGDVTILNFDPSVFPSNANNVIALQSYLPELDHVFDLTVNGSGNPGVTLDGAHMIYEGRIIEMSGTRASFNNIIVANGPSGGITASNYSELRLNSCTIMGNSGVNYGAGLYVDSGSRATVQQTTISGNIANSTGGGVDIYGGGRLVLRNSTVSGNRITAEGDDYGGGGGITIEGEAGVLIVENSTITGNLARTYGGGVYLEGDAEHRLTVVNSIVAGNSAVAAQGRELFAPEEDVVLDLQQNIFGSAQYDTATSVSTFAAVDTANIILSNDQPNSTPLSEILSPLNQNGGRTRTHALPAMSPAINAGNNMACLRIDQLGQLRNDGACDIGSFEFVDEACFVVPTVNSKLVAFCL